MEDKLLNAKRELLSILITTNVPFEVVGGVTIVEEPTPNKLSK